jgi:hypothetical protein
MISAEQYFGRSFSSSLACMLGNLGSGRAMRRFLGSRSLGSNSPPAFRRFARGVLCCTSSLFR